MSGPGALSIRQRVVKWAVRLAIVGGGAGLMMMLPRLMARPPIEVKAVVVERGPVRDVVTSSTAGEVVPERQATVRAELPARVVAVKHRRGDRVKRGDLVVALDADDLEARVAQARAALDSALAQTAQARARVTTLERQAERANSLAEHGAGTTQLSEDSKNLLNEGRQAVSASLATLNQAHAAIRVAQVARGKTNLTAPFDGVLVEVAPDRGEALAPGATVFEIIDNGRLHVDATVDEADSSRVKVGQEAELTLDALPGQRIRGRVARIAPAVRRDLKGARTLAIEVEVVDVKAAAEAGLKSGMSANVQIVVAEKPMVAFLPTHVIVGRGVKRTVYRLAPVQPAVPGVARAEKVAIEVGLGNWDRTEVAGGVVPGDRIVSTLNAKGLDDGALVKVAP
ncbi:MAG: efflux RND transporter periplasmic adaptor subunit [Myxococcales bacterium]|nr:efflux RND transporter periplasmic adaptor subunit [Myxococcales bacterium]